MANSAGVEHLSFRADEGVQLKGWDGTVRASAASEFVPDGSSGWEAGTGQDPERKADEDYTKRSEDSLELTRRATTFIFATARRWPGKQEWVQGKRRDGTWRDVRAYDADDLSTWLESAPAVHLWISAQLGKKPPGTVDLGTFWSHWSNVTSPPTPPELLLATRESTSEELRRQLSRPGASIGLRTETRQEAVAFLAAMVERLSDLEREDILARTVIVEDGAYWSQLATPARRPLILVPMFADRSLVSSAVAAGHTLILPLDRGEPSLRGTIRNPAVPTRRGGARAQNPRHRRHPISRTRRGSPQ